MKLDGHEQGPKRRWAEWRTRRDKSIAKPRRGNAAEKLENLKRKIQMMLAYELGYRSGRRERYGKKYRRACCYEGHNNSSLSLQLQWMDGWFDGITGRRLHRRKNLKPRRPYARKRWPKSPYARRRLESSLHVGVA